MLHLISSPQSLPLLLTLSLSQLTLTWGKVKPFQDSQLAHPFVVVLVAQSCLTLCNPTDGSTPGFAVLQHPPELAQTHVH